MMNKEQEIKYLEGMIVELNKGDGEYNGYKIW